MKIEYASRRVYKTFTNRNNLRKRFGPELSERIQRKIGKIEEAANLDDLKKKVPSLHTLHADLAWETSIYIDDHNRLVMTPILPDGFNKSSPDWSRITGVIIEQLTDYHN